MFGAPPPHVDPHAPLEDSVMPLPSHRTTMVGHLATQTDPAFFLLTQSIESDCPDQVKVGDATRDRGVHGLQPAQGTHASDIPPFPEVPQCTLEQMVHGPVIYGLMLPGRRLSAPLLQEIATGAFS
jgi:hypothetical protein